MIFLRLHTHTQAFIKPLRFFNAFLMLFLISSCGPDVIEKDQPRDGSLTNRSSQPCSPPVDDKDCETIEYDLSMFESIYFDCEVDVIMEVTICDDTEFYFQSTSVTPVDPECIITEEALEYIYDFSVDFYMKTFAEVQDCTSGDISTVSNYIKDNCVSPCFGPHSIGEPAPIIYVPCFTNASGCCIEIKKWCNVKGTPSPIEFYTTTVTGDCTGDTSGACNFIKGSGTCISSRCNK